MDDHKTILIVEPDDRDFEQAVQCFDEIKDSVTILRATTLREAERLVRERNPDEVLLDPGLSDVADRIYGAYFKLSQLIAPERIKIVTGNTSDRNMVEALEGRGSSVIAKRDAYQGNNLPQTVFGIEWMLQRLDNYPTKTGTEKLIEVAVVRRIAPLELELGKLRLSLEQVSAASAKVDQSLVNQQEIKMQLATIAATLNDLNDRLKKAEQSIAGGGSTVELSKVRWQQITAIVTTLLATAATIVGIVYANKSNSDKPAVSSPPTHSP